MNAWKLTAMWKNAGVGAILVAAALVACEGNLGPPGPVGAVGDQGDAGAQGLPGPFLYPDGGAAARGHVADAVGLKMAITGAKIDASGVLTVNVVMTDGQGTPLDLNGQYTDGPVVAKLVVASLGATQAAVTDGGTNLPGEYTAYTTQTHKSADGTKSAVQSDADTGGTWTEVGAGAGTYTYTFGTKLTGYDPAKTHTVGLWAYRDFGGQRWVVNSTFDFVPNGGARAVRDIVTLQGCNGCHNPLGFHKEGTDSAGAAIEKVRRDPKLCVLCHAAPMVDVTNGNALDMTTMIHKIHRGNALPSVLAGTPYVLTADDGTPDDHSGTWFPINALQACSVCHKGSQGQDVWQNHPLRNACGACHDNVSFTTPVPVGKIAHGGGVQPDDTQCASCHHVSGSSIAIEDAHGTGSNMPGGPVVDLQIKSVDTTGPGQTPVLHFTVTVDGAPRDILAAPLSGLATVLAGPTKDFADAEPNSFTIQGAGASGTLALDGAVGSYKYTFPAAIPPAATGTYAIGMEGYITDMARPTIRYASLNPVVYVPVTDAVAVPRRTVVDRNKCNSCHVDLAEHGGIRRSVEYCVLCHTPNKVDDQRIPRFQVPTTVAVSVDFDRLIHKIHRGENLVQGYVTGDYPPPTPANPGGATKDWGLVKFPGNQKACWACHASTSYLLPLPAGLSRVKTEQVLQCNDPAPVATNYCVNRTVKSESFLGPIGGACTACHDAPSTVAHAATLTAPDGTEQCVACHGPTGKWEVQSMHILPP